MPLGYAHWNRIGSEAATLIGDRSVSVEVQFSAATASARAARRFVAEALESAPDREKAVLLTSELVSNAIIHAGTPFTVSVTVTGARVRVAVTDTGGGVPALRPHDANRIGGLGLAMVDAAADRWKIERSGKRTTVWFEVGSSAADRSDPRHVTAGER